MGLTARPVDPRDVTTEISEPTYRVSFWSRDGASCRDYDLTGVDSVDEGLAWADAEVNPVEIYLVGVLYRSEFAPSSGLTFIRLAGDPPPGQSCGERRGPRTSQDYSRPAVWPPERGS